MTPPASPVTALLVPGSLRSGSTNAALLRTAAVAVAPAGVRAVLYADLAALPPFNPDDDREPLHPAVRALRGSLARADAALFCTPEYAGALPGAFKNLLDWTVGGGELDRKAVAWINVASPTSPTGAADAHASLRKVLGYLGAVVVEEACLRLPLTRQDLGADGLIVDPAIRARVADALRVLAARVREGREGGRD